MDACRDYNYHYSVKSLKFIFFKKIENQNGSIATDMVTTFRDSKYAPKLATPQPTSRTTLICLPKVISGIIYNHKCPTSDSYKMHLHSPNKKVKPKPKHTKTP